MTKQLRSAEFPSGHLVFAVERLALSALACDLPRVCMEFNRPGFFPHAWQIPKVRKSLNYAHRESLHNRDVQPIRQPYKSSSANSNSRRWNSQHHGKLHSETGVCLLQDVMVS